MKEKHQPQIISLKDLYISSYLKSKGFPLLDATLDHQRRTIFHFVETPEIKKALMKFYDGTGLVSPNAFIENFKALRSLAYSLSDNLKSIRETK